MTYRNLLLLGLSSVALQGCIAAAALPIVAGSGALVRSGVSDDARSGARESVSVANPPVAASAPTPAPAPTATPALAVAGPSEPVAAAAQPFAPAPLPTPAPTPAPLASAAPEPVIVATLGDVPQGPTISPAPTPAETAIAATPEPEAIAPASEALVAAQLPEEPEAAAPALSPEPPSATIAEVGLPPEPAAPAPEPVELAAAAPVESPVAGAVPEAEPEPDLVSAEPPVEPPAGPSAESVFGQPAVSGYDALANYALRTLGGGLPLPSAMLADPTSLQPIRRDCQGNAPTVVIDLDPTGGVVPIAGPLALNNELARILADLRLRNVQIAWITDRGPIDARAVRDRLVASGLDPASQDSLYVERYPGETKQARRTALAQTQCVIALAGDERSDFDDLYNFVRDLNDARSLEMMLGNGWFIIPNPVGE